MSALNQEYKKAIRQMKFAYNKLQNILTLSKTPYYSRLFSLKKYQKPLKRSKSGFEIELMLIDDKGKMSQNSLEIIRQVNKIYPELNISKEAGKQMIELHSFPSIKVQNTSSNLIQNVIKVMDVAKNCGNLIYPFAAYPGRFEVKVHNTPRYNVQSRILGEKIYAATHGSFCGFHFHYTMPRGVFDYEKVFLKRLSRSKIKHSFIECYNMLIAIDPALITFMQSSPFLNNKYFAKDSRVILTRGGRKLGCPQGLFANKQLLGGLPPYKHTIYDLKRSLRKKDEKWRKLVEKSNLGKETKREILTNKITLDYIWNPVKINKIGTLEQRGMDINYLSYVTASAVLIKYVLRAIQQDFLVVLPSDIGINEPFKVEGNMVYIPPHSYVRNKLQKYAAYEGISNKKVYLYSSKFFKFAKTLMHNRYSNVIKPIKRVIEDKTTISDLIIRKVKKEGYSLSDELPNSFVQEFALRAAEDFIKDMYRTKELVTNLE